jgi:teichuronic acid biosynthesis glycosyltransferase TuaC
MDVDEGERLALSRALILSTLAIQRDATIRERKAAKLHCLTLTPFYPSAQDEVNGCFVAESLACLQSLGLECSVIAVGSIYHRRHTPGPTYVAEWIRYPQIPGNLGLSSAGRFLNASILAKVRELHRRMPIDVIHAHAALPCGHAAALISRDLHIPFVVTIHGLDVFNSCFENGFAAAQRKIASMRVYQSARKVICISEKIRRLVVHEMGSRVNAEVVYNGTDHDLFVPIRGETAVAMTVLVVGNLLAGKGHELVLHALARLQNIYPTLQCRLIGEGADRDRFASLAADLGISNRIHFLGRRSRAEVAEAMRKCTVFVLPSRYEGLGCAYLEAMACAKPVIACRGQGIDEIINHGKNGWLIPVDGLEELVQGLQLLLADSELRVRIGAAARETIASNLTLFHQAENLLRVYEEVTQ